MEIADWHEHLNAVVVQLNAIKMRYQEDFAGKEVSEIEPEEFHKLRQELMKQQGEWMVRLRTIQEQMPKSGVDSMPVEVAKVSSLLLEMTKVMRQIGVKLSAGGQ